MQDNHNPETLACDCNEVDSHADQDFIVGCLRHMLQMPFFRDYKRTSFAKLQIQDGDSVLDLGCGTGEDAQKLSTLTGPSGHVVGLDKSADLINICQASFPDTPGLTFVAGDGEDLAFDDDTFHAARTDRTLQHTDHPATVIAEMTRVTRPGGRVLAFEPDWTTLTASTAFPRHFESLQSFFRAGLKKPGMGSSLLGHFLQSGLVDVSIEPHTLVLTDFDRADGVFHFARFAEAGVEAGALDRSDMSELLGDLKERSEHATLFTSLTFFLALGVKS